MKVAVVAIGRNEGERLRACLQAALRDAETVVYVDSGSTDGSVALATGLGCKVVELDLAKPFTAARARNEGAAKAGEVDALQFVDGDCELVEGWLPAAAAALQADDRLAGVAGRRRERQPEATVYNKLCDMEWDTPVGEAAALGGDTLFRRTAFEQVDGYDATMIAGEEPEMCLRMRKNGWTLRRLDEEMTLHDAAMTSWRQWWKRNVRAGHARAETLDRHPPTGAKEVRSNYLLGLSLPFNALLATAGFVAMTIIASVVESPARRDFAIVFGVALFLVLPVLAAAYGYLYKRIKQYRISRGDFAGDSRLYAKYVLLGKLPQALGQLKYRWNKLRGRRGAIIEYK